MISQVEVGRQGEAGPQQGSRVWGPGPGSVLTSWANKSRPFEHWSTLGIDCKLQGINCMTETTVAALQ